jgi:hypothetical protein
LKHFVHSMMKPGSPLHQVTKYAGPAICVLAALVAFAVAHRVIGGPLFPNDDAFINLHNAQVLWLGHDDAYRDVPALVGATSGAHLALLMLFETFIPADATALFVLGAVVAAFYVVGLFAMCKNVGCSRFEATLIAVAGLVFAGSIFQLLNGLDTGLAMAAVAWNIKLLTDRKRTLWLPVLCGVMPFIRPELGLLSIASMLIILCDRELSVGFQLKGATICALTASPFMFWYWVNTGSFIPNTAGAKMYFYAEQYLDWKLKTVYLAMVVVGAGYISFPIFICTWLIRPHIVRAVLLLFTLVFLGIAFWRFPGGLIHNGGRYLYPFAPIILFGVACGLTSIYRKKTLAYAVASLVVTTAVFTSMLLDYRNHLNGFRKSLVDVVAWMNANLPVDSVVMVHDAGYAAYAGHFPLVDLVGLKTPAATAAHKELTYPSAGRLRGDAVARIADEFQPRYLLVIQNWDDFFHFVSNLRAEGWTAQEIYVGHASAGASAGDVYHLYRIEPPDP